MGQVSHLSFFFRDISRRNMVTIEMRLLSVKDVMDITGWSKAHTYKMINSGVLNAVPTNSVKKLKPIRIEQEELHKLIKGGQDGSN